MPLTNQGVDGPICTTQTMLIPKISCVICLDIAAHSGVQSVQYGKATASTQIVSAAMSETQSAPAGGGGRFSRWCWESSYRAAA